MKKIRKGIFETNSSSSHSIYIDKNVELMDTSMIPDVHGHISISEGEFGWEYVKYTDAYMKASYCATDQRDKHDMIKEVIMEQTGARVVDISGDGYIDHQSGGNSFPAFESKETLRNLIFNPKSIIYTGNDNSEAPLHFYCDSTNGNFKLSIISKEILREKNINDLLDTDEDIESWIDEWVYLFEDNKESIDIGLYEFFHHFIYDKITRDSSSVYPRLNSNVSDGSVLIEYYNYSTKSNEKEETYAIVLKTINK